MILPDKLDQLVIECMKELHSIVEDVAIRKTVLMF